MGNSGLDLFGSGRGQVAGFCENGNELQVYVKFREYFDWLKDY
jgi:hypothetical protein